MKHLLVNAMLLLIIVVLAACAQIDTPVSTPSATSAPRPSGVRALAIDPRDGRLLEARSDGFYQSKDGGKSWTAFALPADIANKGISQVAIRKDQPDMVYIAGEEIGIWRSRDFGKSWTKVTRGLANERVSALALHSNGYPRDSKKTLFAWVAGVGIYQSDDEGDNWRRSPDQGPPNQNVLALTHSPLEGSMNTGWLYAATPDGVYLSMDCF